LEHLNVSWCKGIDTNGLKRVVKACPRLKDLRVSELAGFEDEDFMLELFRANTLERLIMSHCSTITDASLKVLLQGKNPSIDILTDRPIVPPRRLKHLDLSRCGGLTDAGIKHLAHCVPNLEFLQLAFCPNLTDDALTTVIETTPGLSHLDLEELEHLTNHFVIELSKAECAATLEHLNISYCERIGDAGLLKLLKATPNIRSLDLDNTRVSDLTLMEICSQMRKRGHGSEPPVTGLRQAVFDCPTTHSCQVCPTTNSCHVSRTSTCPRHSINQTSPSPPFLWDWKTGRRRLTLHHHPP
jgi:F-box/leucine-rich repeat protein 2/20